MPTFYKKTRKTASVTKQRTFMIRTHKPVKKIAKTSKNRIFDQIELAEKKKKETTVVAKVEKTPPPAPPSPVARVENEEIRKKADMTLQALDSLLQEDGPKNIQPIAAEDTEPVSLKIADKEEDDNAVYGEDGAEEVTAFDGISNEKEQEELYSEAIEYGKRRVKAVNEQIKMIEEEHDAEKKALEREIKELKQELHRTVPLHDNKFFSLSKQLREAITEIQRIASDSGLPVVEDAPAPEMPAPKPSKPVTQPEPAPIKTVEPAPPEEKKTLTKKKTLITGAVASALLVFMAGMIVKNMTGTPKVNEKLVSEYLQQQGGQVQGAQTQQTNAPTQDEDASQANVSFEQSVWEEFKDPSFGIMLQFPKNAVKAIRTESNVTFIRKTGYLFKIQRIETALTLEEYWKQIKATSLNYTVMNEKFKGKEAIKLKLEDMADYPGDRVLVKEGEFIYDIWYATPSNTFPDDDIKRAEKMLSSLSIVGAR